MADAVASSDAVIVIVSRKYKESANCQRECVYAARLNRKIIPLMAEDGYTGDGWLGLLIGPLLYYEAYTTEALEQSLRAVMSKELRRMELGREVTAVMHRPAVRPTGAGADGGAGGLTADQVRSIVAEEVAKAKKQWLESAEFRAAVEAAVRAATS